SRYARCSSAAETSPRSSIAMASSAVRRSVSIMLDQLPPGGHEGPLWQRRTQKRTCLRRLRAESPRTPASRRRHPERAVLRRRRVRQRDVAVERRARLVLGEHVDEIERMRGRRHVVEVELRDLADRLEDRSELPLEAFELILGEREPRELRDVEHLISRDR